MRFIFLEMSYKDDTHEVNLLIAYNSERIRDICCNSSVAIQCLGEDAAVLLQDRHADIQAANNVFELLVGQVAINGNNCTLSMSNLLSIVMAANYPAAADGSYFDWSTVGRVKIMEINHVK